ncbi:MAG: hypothetical protein JSR18_08530 [Proteobacteria bacterium]|nr:hypothetical protein [Pseudomonadota bacterium]
MTAPADLVGESVARLCAKHAPLALAQEAVAGRFEDAVWDAFREAGLLDAMVDDGSPAADGVGGLAAAVSVARVAAHAAVPLPIVEALIAARLRHEAGDDAVAQGAHVALAALPDAAAPASKHGARVGWGRHASSIYVPVARDGGYAVLRYDRAAATVEPGEDIAGQPRDLLRPRADAQPAVFTTQRTPADVLAWGALLRAAQMVGAMDRTFELALEHANTRVQFGRPLGKFQMVQQMLAIQAAEIAAATAAVDLAAAATDQASLHYYAAVAKGVASAAVRTVCDCAHQVTGAMGYTREFSLHLFTRRLWAWRDDCGSEAHWHAYLGRTALAGGAAGLWPLIVRGPAAPVEHA